jgi:hypothetical protein
MQPQHQHVELHPCAPAPARQVICYVEARAPGPPDRIGAEDVVQSYAACGELSNCSVGKELDDGEKHIGREFGQHAASECAISELWRYGNCAPYFGSTLGFPRATPSAAQAQQPTLRLRPAHAHRHQHIRATPAARTGLEAAYDDVSVPQWLQAFCAPSCRLAPSITDSSPPVHQLCSSQRRRAFLPGAVPSAAPPRPCSEAAPFPSRSPQLRASRIRVPTHGWLE